MKNKIMKRIIGLNIALVPVAAVAVATPLITSEIANATSTQVMSQQKSATNSNLINLETAKLNISKSSYVYTGKEIVPGYAVISGMHILSENVDFKIKLTNNVNTGTATITAIGIGRYTGSKSVNFKITKATDNEITSFKIVNNTPVATAKYGEVKFQYSRDLINWSTSQPTTGGTWFAKPYVEETENYNGVIHSKYLNFMPQPTYNLSTANVNLSSYNFAYTGHQIVPGITVIDVYNVLKQGQDFIVAHSNNVNVGVATLIVQGIGKYTGYKIINFNITKATDNEIIDFRLVNNYPVGEAKYGVTKFRYSKDLVNWSNTYPVVGGLTFVQAYVDETANYNGAVSAQYLYLMPQPTFNLNSAIINISSNTYKYTGKEIKPGIAVIDVYHILQENRDYVVEYSNNINVGVASITVKGIGSYTGQKTITFNIVK